MIEPVFDESNVPVEINSAHSEPCWLEFAVGGPAFGQEAPLSLFAKVKKLVAGVMPKPKRASIETSRAPATGWRNNWHPTRN